MFTTLALLGTLATGAPDTWPPRELLVRSLAAGVERTLKTQDPATGRFGTQPWICNDQNVLWPLAAAWALDDPDNPWHHSPGLLAAIAKGGEALVEAQDAKGMWEFRKKDNSTWGPIHMPWTYSRWIRAWRLVRDALPADSRAKWERGLLLGFAGIRRYMDGGVHNIPTHHAMALWLAGESFGNTEWQDAAKAFMARVVAKQDPAGYWSEHFGPVVGYNEVYVDALGIYYGASKDPVVLEALRRSARFHSAVLFPDGSAAAAIDERQIYHAAREYGTVGFSWTPEGRGYLLSQWAPVMESNGNANDDSAATHLYFGGEGPGERPAALADQARQVIGEGGALIERRKPWQMVFSAYACDAPDSRWIQDRHNLVDVFHDELGLVVGGGNTKLQPYWSTFTVGDPALLTHRAGDESPDFTPDIPLRWTPSQAALALDEAAPGLDLQYGEVAASVRAEVRGEALALVYGAQPAAGERVEAHVPLLKRGGKLKLASGEARYLTEEPLELTAEQIGDHFTWSGLRVSVPAGASLRWPMRQHDPYRKDGRSSLAAAKLVLVLPLTAERPEQTVELSRAVPEAVDGLAFQALDLPVTSPTGTRLKRLDDLGSMFLASTAAGQAMAFTLPAVPAGEYELLARFVRFPGYAIVRLLVDGQPVGQPFDAWAPELDTEDDLVSFGPVRLAAGEHTVTVETTGRREGATGGMISVQQFVLRPR